MIYLAKTLPVFLMPLGLSFALMVAGLVLQKRTLIWSGALCLYLFSNGVVSGILMRAVEAGYVASQPRQLPQADAVLVLSGILDQRPGIPLGEWTEGVDRFEGGVNAFLAGKAPKLIFTGGAVPWQSLGKPEGEILRVRAEQLGVPEKSILVSGKAGNTEEEAREVKGLAGLRLANGQPTRIILVTSAFHMRRARLIFEQQGFIVFPYPVDFQSTSLSEGGVSLLLKFFPRAGFLLRSETAVREMLGLSYYRIFRPHSSPKEKI